MKKIRCAIYTRKSSDEGLEQDFNSLDAQREACAAYVLSQASEGWTLLPAIYDDGGISGGTLERPALQRRLADVHDGQVDIIVVYKVDRLTRSLLDFAKLVEAFDKAGTSFVSVTQSFNTTTSMGRLTLNMLLSFAQFEREVTAERIRDKIAASKARGMWMGGTPPLGYRPEGRSLVIVPEHAAVIRDIYDGYLALGSVRRLANQLHDQGVKVPRRTYGSGRALGGGPFSRGQLYFILGNATYAGMIVHKDKVYPGQHAAIIDQDIWDRVQRMLADHVQGERRIRIASPSLLAGRIVDGVGEPLIASHANKGKVRYRYYVSRSAHFDATGAGIRIPAREIEGLVTDRVAGLFCSPLTLIDQVGLDVTPDNLQRIVQLSTELHVTLRGSRRAEVADLVQRVRIGEGEVAIDIAPSAIATMLGTGLVGENPPPLTLTENVRLTRTGRVMRLVDGKGAPSVIAGSDTAALTMLVTARRWWARLSEGDINIVKLSALEGVTPSWMRRVLRLAFLAAPLAEAILDGTHRADALGSTLIAPGAITACWQEQARRFLAQPA